MPITTEFKLKEIEDIPGLLEISIEYPEDDRGYFMEKFQKEKLIQIGFPPNFQPIQYNVVYNKNKGVIRGIHQEPWDKYIGVITGKIFAVFVDLRKGKNFGKKYSVISNTDKTFFVPNGVGNSYQTLEDDTHYSYLVNGHWDQSLMYKYPSVNPYDKELLISWPISPAIISEKDKQAPSLARLRGIQEGNLNK